MEKAIILTAGVSNLTAEQCQRFNIEIIPYYIIYNGKTEKETLDFDRVAFYKLLPSLKQFPTTSQPSVEDVEAIYRNLLDRYEWIIHPELSSKYSAAYDVSLKAKENLGNPERIILIDTRKAIALQGLLVIELAEYLQEGKSVPEILERYEQIKDRMDWACVLDTLEYLAKGGRIHKAQAFLGSLLSVRPIIGMKEGMTVPLTRVRSHRQGLDWIKKQIDSQMKLLHGSQLKLFFEHTGVLDWMNIAREELLKEFPVKEDFQAPTSVVAGAHIGPGAWGVSWLIL